ncbi:hypothetical protein H6F90_08200 [Trichocoleus sp. FACHB-591]|uniref:hypothetical protein n=1 Tax=Trichocoleus sp. FACHB-591 TaxID=2692872 RepID=UPI001689D965|nr:hypothetical protein [Trichocoleus sp. FACHB-591]MBD2095135.1 hypothetical protein [Trichocoleus sp. FACHB-591]
MENALDGGEQEKKVIEDLKNTYTRSGWKEDHFLQFKEHEFERYYPTEFQSRVAQSLKGDKESRKKSKKNLFHDVEAWIQKNPELAKAALEESAAEVISVLRQIESNLASTQK